MNKNAPSDTYKKLYAKILGPLLKQLCESNPIFAVKVHINNMPMPLAVWSEYNNYFEKAVYNMKGSRLDRHKLASCICGAIIKVRPLTGVNGAAIPKNANELLALYTGLSVIKFYMFDDFLDSLHNSEDCKAAIREFLAANFEIHYPDNTHDTQEYQKNLANALFWTHSICKKINKECFQYDLWAYAKIFHHLELYNMPILQQVGTDFLKSSENAFATE